MLFVLWFFLGPGALCLRGTTLSSHPQTDGLDIKEVKDELWEGAEGADSCRSQRYGTAPQERQDREALRPGAFHVASVAGKPDVMSIYTI